MGVFNAVERIASRSTNQMLPRRRPGIYRLRPRCPMSPTTRSSADFQLAAPRSEAGRALGAASSRGPWDHPRLHRQQALALQFLARELAGAADGFRLLSDSLLGGFLVMAAELHLAEDALALHLLLQHLESLVDIVVTDEYLHAAFLFDRAVDGVVTGCGRRVLKTALDFGLALQ